ncbi:uncharacterized protein MT2145 [Bos taurus]|uniref:uncharacterized protein MT2145 n=1 Tax=Bos taurus TaxID=9913 RepID=UPI0028CB1467|nr:uncharacterized protein MT2145-like [Bos taurus]
MERGRRPPPALSGPPPACPAGCRPAGPGRRPEPRVPAPLPRGCQLLALPGALPLDPGAMAGWGSWGWDLLPVTNHIARDFQPTLSPVSGAAIVTATAEDADPGDGDGVAARPPLLTSGLGSRA